MLKVNSIQTNFTSGELSPWLLGRSDIERYANGAAKLENFIVRHQGGVLYRPGAERVGLAASQNPAANVRLLDFVFSRDDAICIEISAGKFRFIRGNAFIGAPYEVTGVPYLDADISELQFAQSADVIFIAHPDYPPATLSRFGDTNWVYEILQFAYGPYQDQEIGEQDTSLHLSTPVDLMTLTSTNGGEYTGRVPGDYVQYAVAGELVLGQVDTAISGASVRIKPLEDLSLRLSEEVYSPGVYTGWDNTNSVPLYSQVYVGTVTVAFSATAVVTQANIGNYLRFCDKNGVYRWMKIDSVGDIVKQGAYGILATGPILTVAVPTGIITRSARSTRSVLTSSDNAFFTLPRDIGRKFRLVLGSTVVHATVTPPQGLEAPNTPGSCNVSLSRTLPRTTEGLATTDVGTTNDWNRGAWFLGNFPGAVGFHEERLGFAGTYAEPQTVWLSMSADLFNFASTDEDLVVSDNSAITATVASDTINQILWMSSRRGVLVLGTVGGEMSLNPSGSNVALTATNISVQHQSNFGSEFVKPVAIGNFLLYLQRGGYKVRQLSYDYNSDSQMSLDLTVFAEHILKDHGGANALSYQHLPESILYVLCNDGQVCVLTYEPDQKVYAWSRLILGGNGYVESIASVPVGNRFMLYMTVLRTNASGTYRTIEVMPPEFRPNSAIDYASATFLDNWRFITYGGAVAPAVISGLQELTGQVVWGIVGTQFFYGTVSPAGDLTVPAGIIRTGTPSVRVGLPYEGWFQAFPIETPAMAGTGQAKVKRIDHLSLRLLNSMGFSHGPDVGALRYEDFRKKADPAGAPPPMRSEDYRVPYDNGFDVRAQYNIKQTKPYPLCILAIMPELAQHQ